MRRMTQLSGLKPVSTEQGQVEIAQLLAIGVVRVLSQQSSQGKLDSESVRAETSADGLEDS
jgi:hypothetical protein